MGDELQDDTIQEGAEEEVEEKVEKDPGQEEGKPKKPEPPPDSKRWDKVYGRMKTAERAVEEFKKQLTDRDSQYERDIEALRKHNEALIASLKPQEHHVSADVSEIKGKIKELRVAKVNARKDSDWDREALIEDQLEDLKERLARQESEEFRNRVKKEAKQEAKVETVNDELLEWQVNTAWFNKESESFDPLMRGAAIELDTQYLQDRKWANKPLKSRLAEVRKVVEERFGWGQSPIKGKIPSTEGVGGIHPQKRESVTLNEDEKRVARLMFREKPPEEAEKIYAEQKKIIARGK